MSIYLLALSILHPLKTSLELYFLLFPFYNINEPHLAELSDWPTVNRCKSRGFRFTAVKIDKKTSKSKDFLLIWLQLLLRANIVFRVTDYCSSIKLVFEVNTITERQDQSLRNHSIEIKNKFVEWLCNLYFGNYFLACVCVCVFLYLVNHE